MRRLTKGTLLCWGWFALGSTLVGCKKDIRSPDSASADSAEAMGGEIHRLEEFRINIEGDYGFRTLVMELALEIRSDAGDSLDDHRLQIRDAVLLSTDGYTVADLTAIEGKLRLRDEILVRIDAIVAPAGVDRVYFLQFHIE